MSVGRNTELVFLFFVGFVLLNAPIVPLLQGQWLFGRVPALFAYCFGIWLLLILWLLLVQVRASKRRDDEV